MLHINSTNGWNNADQVTGKSKEDITVDDKGDAALAGALSVVAMGLVDDKTIYQGMKKSGATEALRRTRNVLAYGSVGRTFENIDRINKQKQKEEEQINQQFLAQDRKKIDTILQKQQLGETLTELEKAKFNMYEKDEKR